jgi:hypothetical protein
MRTILDIANVTNLAAGREPAITINGVRLLNNVEKLLRPALLFQIDQHTSNLECMMDEGGQLEERIFAIQKRRYALEILELLDGVLPASQVHPTSVQFEINNRQLTQDMIDVARQALMSYKQYKLRGSALDQAEFVLTHINGSNALQPSSA